MNYVLELLTSAKALIDSPEKWTKGTLARSANLNSVFVGSNDAVCFCSQGAVRRAALITNKDVRPSYDSDVALHYLDIASPDGSIITYNDSHTHEEVMAVWDKAIELVKAEV